MWNELMWNELTIGCRSSLDGGYCKNSKTYVPYRGKVYIFLFVLFRYKL
jgi:hypothetical protein